MYIRTSQYVHVSAYNRGLYTLKFKYTYVPILFIRIDYIRRPRRRIPSRVPIKYTRSFFIRE